MLPVLGNGGRTYFGYFSRFAYVQPYHSKGLGESFPLIWLNIGLCWKITKIRTIPVLVSYPKQVWHSPKTGVLFLLWRLKYLTGRSFLLHRRNRTEGVENPTSYSVVQFLRRKLFSLSRFRQWGNRLCGVAGEFPAWGGNDLRGRPSAWRRPVSVYILTGW